MESPRYYLEFERPICELEEKIVTLKSSSAASGLSLSAEIKSLEENCTRLKTEIYGNLTPWQRVQLARHPQRPYLLDYIPLIFEEFTELHGDRCFADDKSVVAGLAVLDGRPCALVGQQKGRNLDENLVRNYGMPNPEGYRKAARIMKLAEKFALPIFSFIDTPGAYPGLGAEERGQAEAIASNLKTMAALETPVIAAVIGEGGSGGALGIGVADKILMLENAYYSVISPEGCSAILFKDSSRAPEAAAALKITAPDLVDLGVVDEIVPEPLGGADKDLAATAASLKKALVKNLSDISKIPSGKLPEKRYAKYRAIGAFAASPPVTCRRGKPPRAKSHTKNAKKTKQSQEA